MAVVLWIAKFLKSAQTTTLLLSVYGQSIALSTLHTLYSVTSPRDITLTWTSCDWSTKTDTQSDTCSHSQNGWTSILSAGPED